MGLCIFTCRGLHTRWPREWSSAVCSSDLVNRTSITGPSTVAKMFIVATVLGPVMLVLFTAVPALIAGIDAGSPTRIAVVEIGRASCRERVVNEVVAAQ